MFHIESLLEVKFFTLRQFLFECLKLIKLYFNFLAELLISQIENILPREYLLCLQHGFSSWPDDCSVIVIENSRHFLHSLEIVYLVPDLEILKFIEVAVMTLDI